MPDNIARARELIAGAKKILVFTGAGVSTGSGIPDYRGPDGVWQKREPVLYRDFLASTRAKLDYWKYKADTFPAFRAAVPNAAHKALVELERGGRLLALVTQNIDSLHRTAGSHTDKLTVC